jgi:hypothetical protein
MENIALYKPITFKDLREVMLQEGILGQLITIEINLDGERFPTNGFFMIDQDSLCFSDAFIFETQRFGIDISDSHDIDF